MPDVAKVCTTRRVTMPCTWPDAATSPAPSTYTRWPGMPRRRSGSSTRCSRACARWIRNPASCRAGDPSSSAITRRKIAAISTDWRCATASRAISPHWRNQHAARLARKQAQRWILDRSATPTASSCRGLSMPHSPRWYDGQSLWVLESGRGALVTIDPKPGGTRMSRACRDSVAAWIFWAPSPRRHVAIARDQCLHRYTDHRRQRRSPSGVWAVTSTPADGRIPEIHRRRAEIFAVQAVRGVLFPEIISDRSTCRIPMPCPRRHSGRCS